ncbi:MAG: DNA mismatch repair protein MutH [Deltaproteobacteria bacterium]|nr:DNA mismatch repair protein MutH [Deltaproteobacteria bacterium]
MRSAPKDLASLRARAHDLAGRSLAELAAAESWDLPPDLRRHKGFVGRLLEAALGAPGDSAEGPDFAQLGVELKTLPIKASGRPAESTFVCRAQLARMPELDWEQSNVRQKLAHVLFVPIESEGELASRRVGCAFEWIPSAAEEAQMRADYEEAAEILARAELEKLTAHLGQVLQLRPKAASGREVTLGPGDDAHAWTRPRGFYLRARFTAGLLAQLSVSQ